MYIVKLEKFEGPLGLLLNLIEEQKLDICEVSLAKIADQYLEYLNKAALSGGIKLANLAYFLVIASRLILIKSRALLPFLKLSEEEEEEIKDLEERLQEYKKFKELAKRLGRFARQKHILYSREAYLNIPKMFFPPANIRRENLFFSFQNIIDTFEKFEKSPTEQIKAIISIEEKIKNIQNRVKNAVLKFSEIIKEAQSKIDIIVSFLATLELIRNNFVLVEQNEIFGEITLIKLNEKNNQTV